MFIAGCIMVIIIILLNILVLSVMERKIAGFAQQRVGPFRIGPHGWAQALGDGLKLMGKEDITPAGADKLIYKVAPIIIFSVPIMALSIIPFGENMAPVNLELGIMYYFAITSISTVGFFMGGWGSNNKYSLIGGMRAVAQMISYEIPLIFSLLGVVMITQSYNLGAIVEAQETVPFVLLQPLAFVIFMIAGMAEANRAPFDLVEGEQEVVAGPFTEYSGLRHGLFWIGEYSNLLLLATITTTVFLGGWQGPDFLPGWVVFWLKVGGVVFFTMWARWTFPRLRIDHLMHLSWKVLLPLSILNIILTGLGICIYRLVIGG
jgi:NADH-quinone oxidoreductase subunit H